MPASNCAPPVSRSYSALLKASAFLAVILMAACSKKDPVIQEDPKHPVAFIGSWKLTHFIRDGNDNNIMDESRQAMDTAVNYALNIINDHRVRFTNKKSTDPAGYNYTATYTWWVDESNGEKRLYVSDTLLLGVLTGGFLASGPIISSSDKEIILGDSGLNPQDLGYDPVTRTDHYVWAFYTKQ